MTLSSCLHFPCFCSSDQYFLKTSSSEKPQNECGLAGHSKKNPAQLGSCNSPSDMIYLQALKSTCSWTYFWILLMSSETQSNNLTAFYFVRWRCRSVRQAMLYRSWSFLCKEFQSLMYHYIFIIFTFSLD